MASQQARMMQQQATTQAQQSMAQASTAQTMEVPAGVLVEDAESITTEVSVGAGAEEDGVTGWMMPQMQPEYVNGYPVGQDGMPAFRG